MNLASNGTYVSFSTQDTVFGEKAFVFKVTTIRNGKSYQVSHMATSEQLRLMHDARVVADAMLESLNAEMRK